MAYSKNTVIYHNRVYNKNCIGCSPKYPIVNKEECSCILHIFISSRKWTIQSNFNGFQSITRYVNWTFVLQVHQQGMLGMSLKEVEQFLLLIFKSRKGFIHVYLKLCLFNIFVWPFLAESMKLNYHYFTFSCNLLVLHCSPHSLQGRQRS